MDFYDSSDDDLAEALVDDLDCGHECLAGEVVTTIGGIRICPDCDRREAREASMDAYDIAYERAIANGWED